MTTKRLKNYRTLILELETCTDAQRKRVLTQEINLILNWIYSLGDPLTVSIFKERYITARKDRSIKPRAWWQVAQHLHYSEDHIKHIHSLAINAQK